VRFAVTEALLSGRAAPDAVDELAWLLEGGPANRTQYMAPAAKRAAARLVQTWPVVTATPVLRMTDAYYPLDCGSRFD
jgi:vacuolar-type H+-ATPase catalytic subunit A/Vma1